MCSQHPETIIIVNIVCLLDHCRWVHRQVPTQGAGLQGQSDDTEQVDIGVVDSELHKRGSG